MFDLEYELYRAQHDYAGLSECDASFDADIWHDAVDAARSYETTWKPLIDDQPLPSATLQELRDVYDVPYREYLANGGTDSFEDWLADGMPSENLDGHTTSVAKYDPRRENHVFRPAEGHMNPSSDSERTRYIQLFENVASNDRNFRPDAVRSGLITSRAESSGVIAYTMVLPDGTQAWVVVRNGLIQNAGINLAGSFR